MKYLPTRMISQLLLLLTAGLVVAHLATVVVLHVYSDALSPVARDHIFEHMASAYHMVQVVPDHEIDQLLKTFSSDEAWFYLSDKEPQAEQPQQFPVLYQQLSVRLPDASGLHVRMEQQQMSLSERLLNLPVVWVYAAAGLPDGRWLIAVQKTHNDRPVWWWLVWLPVSVLPALLVAMVFLWRTLRPIKALTEAAEHVSRGERIDPLPATGPDEIKEVSIAFNTMQENLTRFVDDRTRLLAAISHDVRTPIASLRVRAELVDDVALRNAMIATLENMSVIVEQTLSFARDDAYGEPCHDIDLRSLLETVVFDSRVVHQQAEIELEPGEPYRCRVRPNSFQRALTNLLDNAVCHGGGKIRVRLLKSPLRIEIDDSGPGVNPEDIEHLFTPFFQASRQRGRIRSGTGLGLAIARSCARAHGGDVVVSNLPQGGFRATLQLPF